MKKDEDYKKYIKEAKKAIKPLLNEIEAKLIAAWLSGKQDGVEMAVRIYNEYYEKNKTK